MFMGTLYYADSKDTIIVKRLIDHGDRVSIELSSTWITKNNERDEWLIDAQAKQRRDGQFSTLPVHAKDPNGDEALDSTVIVFKLTALGQDEIQVDGEWIEPGERYAFSGTLSRSPIGQDASRRAQ